MEPVKLEAALMTLAAEAGEAGLCEVEGVLLLVLRVVHLPVGVRQRVVLVMGEVVGMAEWMERRRA